MSQTHMVSTYRSSTITPVHRSCSRPPSDTRNSLSRVDSPSSATACPEGSTGRSRLCRRSKRSRTRHGPHERTSEPKAHARPSMWRPCSPDGEVCIGPRPPLRDPAPYLAKTAFPLELTLGTFVIHTYTKPGRHGALPGDLGGGVRGHGRCRRSKGRGASCPGARKGITPPTLIPPTPFFLLHKHLSRAC